ncbi:MAG: hypothetical protein QOG62_2198 [Thermoleophilaceae bacterium]|jgi:uncharacterized membrane protein|nr:hypothetical protein [Thermoleophilaceae bacterium]
MNGRAGLYAVLTVIGLAPLIWVAPWAAEYGFDLQLMSDGIFGSTLATAVFADVTVSSLVFWVWSFGEAKARGITWWYFPILNLVIGLCFALPLFLYQREKHPAL